jgi:cytochrome P450
MLQADPITEHEDFFQHTHRLMARLRAASPVRRVRLGAGGEGWLVTRYGDARAASSAPKADRDYATLRRLAWAQAEPANPAADHPEDVLAWFRREVLYLDPPEHARLRTVVREAFTPAAIGRLRPRVEQATSDLLDKITGPGPVNLMPAVAEPLPLIVICELLGVPERERPDFTRWAHVINSGIDDEATTADAYREVGDYLEDLAWRRRLTPGDDLISILVAAEERGQLSCDEVASMALLTLVAGHDTTVSLIGNGLLELLKAPAQLALLRSDPALLPNAVEELLRFACPVNISSVRFTREPLELSGTVIPAGERLFVSILSANRDAGQFDNPDALDITRETSGHLAFGHGIHYCLGAPLARLEIQAVLRALLDRFPGLRLTADPGTLQYRRSTLLHAPATLPVYLD